MCQIVLLFPKVCEHHPLLELSCWETGKLTNRQSGWQHNPHQKGEGVGRPNYTGCCDQRPTRINLSLPNLYVNAAVLMFKRHFLRLSCSFLFKLLSNMFRGSPAPKHFWRIIKPSFLYILTICRGVDFHLDLGSRPGHFWGLLSPTRKWTRPSFVTVTSQ